METICPCRRKDIFICSLVFTFVFCLYGTVQCHPGQCSIVQYSAEQYSLVQCSTLLLYSIVKECRVLQFSSISHTHDVKAWTSKAPPPCNDLQPGAEISHCLASTTLVQSPISRLVVSCLLGKVKPDLLPSTHPYEGQVPSGLL